LTRTLSFCIGKIAVPDEVLHKPSPLTAAEEEIMHAHVTAGERILDPVPGLDGVGRLVRHSHERWDGSGYPDGLAADAIPLGARIIAVADAWHAMTSTRPYRVAMSHAEASAELRACAGRQFDPELVTVFLSSLDGGA
jgi:HD-GYP domain-containing protein (c-di-GMP phosphodiesterase class II)